jgi:hypothetical protein
MHKPHRKNREGYIVESIGEVRVGILDGNASVASEVTVRGRELEVPTRTKEESTEKPDSGTDAQRTKGARIC